MSCVSLVPKWESKTLNSSSASSKIIRKSLFVQHIFKRQCSFWEKNFAKYCFHLDMLVSTLSKSKCLSIHIFMRSLRNLAAINFSFNGSHLYVKNTKFSFNKNVKSVGIFKNSINGEFCQVCTAIVTKYISF